MANLGIQKQNIYTTEATQSSVVVASNTSAPIEMVSKEVVEGQGNVDVAQTTNTSTTEKTTKRTAEELYKSIEALCTKYGLSFSEVKKFGLLERIAGCPQEVLLNLDNSEIQKLLECLKAALAKLSPNGQKIDIEKLAELAQDYNIAIHTGWTIEGFQKAQDTKKHESLKQRLERMYPGKSPEKALDLYFNSYFEEQIKNKLVNVTDPTERERIIAQEKKRQLQDFGRLLANSSDEERMLFRDAIKSLYANNRLKGLEALFKSLDTQEARTEVADSCSPDYIEELQEKEDVFGEQPSQEEVAGSTQVIARNQSEVGRKDFHEKMQEKTLKFFEENKEIIAKIQEKIAKGEQLTEEEQAIKDKIDGFFTPVASGEILGTAENCVISEDAKIEILELINKDAFEQPNYRDVLTLVVEQAKNPKNLTISNTELTELLNKTTNGNYTKVVNDVATGTKTELLPPAATVESNVAEVVATQSVDVPVQTGSLGFETKPVDTGYAKALTEQLYNQTAPVLAVETPVLEQNKAPETLTEAFKTGLKGIKQFVSKANISNKEITLNILNSTTGVGTLVREWALDKFEKMSRPIQRMTFEGIENNSSAIAAAQRMSADDLENIRFKNHYLTAQVNDIIEEKEKIAQKA